MKKSKNVFSFAKKRFKDIPKKDITNTTKMPGAYCTLDDIYFLLSDNDSWFSIKLQGDVRTPIFLVANEGEQQDIVDVTNVAALQQSLTPVDFGSARLVLYFKGEPIEDRRVMSFDQIQERLLRWWDELSPQLFGYDHVNDDSDCLFIKVCEW